MIVSRCPEPFESMNDCRIAFDRIDRELASIDRDHAALMVDLRSITGRNDPEFESTVAPLRKQLLTSFTHCAMVVATFIGKLQVQRHLREDGLDIRVYIDPAVALASLRQAMDRSA